MESRSHEETSSHSYLIQVRILSQELKLNLQMSIPVCSLIVSTVGFDHIFRSYWVHRALHNISCSSSRSSHRVCCSRCSAMEEITYALHDLSLKLGDQSVDKDQVTPPSTPPPSTPIPLAFDQSVKTLFSCTTFCKRKHHALLWAL